MNNTVYVDMRMFAYKQSLPTLSPIEDVRLLSYTR